MWQGRYSSGGRIATIPISRLGDGEDGSVISYELAAVDEGLEDDEEQEEAAEEEMAVSLPPLQTPPLLTRDKKQAPGSCD